MNVKRILLLASMALAAVALAAPVTAQGFVRLTSNTGAALKKGDPVTVTSTNLITTTVNGTLECELVTLHYTVEVNGNNHVVLKPVIPFGSTHNGTTKGCNLNTGMGLFPAHIEPAGANSLTIYTWGTGEVDATFTVKITSPAGPIHCTFIGRIPFQGAASGTDVVNIETPAKLTIEPSPPCPPIGEMHGSLTLESSTGAAINLDFMKTG